MVAGVLFLGDVLFEIPSNVMLGRIGARRSLSRIMALWGCVTMLMMFATGATSLYVLRFLLGAAEAGFMPGCLLFPQPVVPEPCPRPDHQRFHRLHP
ncbi:MAG: hypothetical protein WDN49_05850, partial [Acetobacteraceae bacterium]